MPVLAAPDNLSASPALRRTAVAIAWSAGLDLFIAPAAAEDADTPLLKAPVDTFSFETIGENANGIAGAIFTVGDDGKASKVVLDYYDRTGLGTFVR